MNTKQPIKHQYHSALTEEMSDLRPLQHYANNGSLVFKHDVCDGWAFAFGKADAIYAEPAWRPGFEKFMARADQAEQASFDQYMDGILEIVERFNKPTFVVAGAHHRPFYRRFDPTYFPIVLHGASKCFLAVFNDVKTFRNKPPTTNEEALQKIAKSFNVIADFSCGYGQTAAVALENGKRFICSDVNAKCVGYVAETFLGYTPKI